MARQYGHKSYWDRRYEGDAEDDATDEWLLSYQDLACILQGAMSRGVRSRVLDIGIGTSRLLCDLCTDGHAGELVGIDISGVKAAQEVCKGFDIEVTEADVRNCANAFGTECFDLAIDKSTIDAMLCDEASGLQSIKKEAREISKILSVGGCFVVVSHNRPSADIEVGHVDEWLEAVISGLLQDLPRSTQSWTLDVHISCLDAPSVYVFRKLRRSGRRYGEVQVLLARFALN